MVKVQVLKLAVSMVGHLVSVLKALKILSPLFKAEIVNGPIVN